MFTASRYSSTGVYTTEVIILFSIMASSVWNEKVHILDWATGMDYWTGIFCFMIHFSTLFVKHIGYYTFFNTTAHLFSLACPKTVVYGMGNIFLRNAKCANI